MNHKSQKIVLKGYINIPDDDLDAVKDALPLHIRLTQQEEGCLVFKVEEDRLNPNIFNVYEEFSNKKSFQAHQERVRESEWRSVTKNITRHYQILEE
jgi:quinol monooxygenase YgiN